MNLSLTPFINEIQNLRCDVKSRQKIAAISIGYAIACNAALPSSQVASASEYYDTTVRAITRSFVSQFNEAWLLDTNYAQEFVRNFWLMRYDAVHTCPRLDQIPGDFFCSVFGVMKYFSEEDKAFCDAHNTSIAAVYRSACNYIADSINPNKERVL